MSGINRLAVNNLRFQSPNMEDRDGKINVRQGINTARSSSSTSNSNLNGSSYSAASNSTINNTSNNNTSSSKAVLAALRALQDKIRRLEAEKTQAQDETKQLRLQIQNQEIEFDHDKQKEKLNLQKSLHEIRSSYDSVLNEKNELELRVSKQDERNKDLRLQSEELYDQIQAIEAEKHQQEYKYKDLESKHLQLEVQMDRAQQREKDLTLSMTKEARKSEEERMNLVVQLDKVRDQLEYTARDKGLHDKRLVELDELVMQLLNLNEVLVSKLTESNTSNLMYKKILGIPKKTIAPTVSQDSVKTNVRSRSATRATSSSGGRSSQRDRERESQHAQDDGPEIDEYVARLNTLHKMYKGLAKAILEPRFGSEGYGTGMSINGNVRDSSLNMSSLHQAAVTSNNLLSNKKKKSTSGSSGSSGKLNQSSDNNKTTSLFGQSSRSNSNGALQFNSSYDNGDNLSALSLAAELRGSGSRGGSSSVLGSPLRRSGGGSGSGEYDSNTTGIRSPYAPLRSPLRSTGSSGFGSGSSSSTVDINHIISTSSNPPLQKVISSLEDEFEILSTQYRRILLSMQRDPAAVDPNLAGGTTIQHSDELMTVIQQLQRKGEQLRTLKASL